MAEPDVVTDGVVPVLIDKSPAGSVEELVEEVPVLSEELDEVVVETSSWAWVVRGSPIQTRTATVIIMVGTVNGLITLLPAPWHEANAQPTSQQLL